MKKYYVLIALVFLLSSLFSQNENLGTTGFSFLKVNYSAHAAAMANAYTGIANDVGAVFFNPAGIVQLKNKALSSTYMNYLLGVQCGSAIFVMPRNDTRTLAVFTQFLTTHYF